MLSTILDVTGALLFAMITFIGIRMLSYWRSFLFAFPRYRIREHFTTEHLKGLAVPNIKIQFTTRGSAGSTEVILRGIRNVVRAAADDPIFYRDFLSVELVTESSEQIALIQRLFRDGPIRVSGLLVPASYQTPNGTQLKARALHCAVEERLKGWNAIPGRTFIVHLDEESVLVPVELRRLITVLAGSTKKVLEGPIYYPLEYLDAGVLCRSMEANRPVGCFECRHVMEKGVPLHLHGSNLVVEEEFENEIGWDIGCLEGSALVAEDYVFGLRAFTSAGSSVFGWHGVVLLEQPPFSVRSAFKQRYRWVFGVLQGLALNKRLPQFRQLARSTRRRIMWGTRYRIATFALGCIAGTLSMLILPFLLARMVLAQIDGVQSPMWWGVNGWLAVVGALWLGSVLIGAWCNVAYAAMGRLHRLVEIGLAVAVAPVAGIIESSAGLWAVIEWTIGRRRPAWEPTPKTVAADRDVQWSSSTR